MSGRKSSNKTVGQRQSTFHMPLSSLQQPAETLLANFQDYIEASSKMFAVGSHISDVFQRLFSGTSFANITCHFFEISKELAKAVEGYMQGMIAEITKDMSITLTKVNGSKSNKDAEINSFAESFLQFLQMQTQIFLSSLGVFSQFTKVNNLDELQQQVSNATKSNSFKRSSLMSLENLKLEDSRCNVSSTGIQTDSMDSSIKKQLAKASQFFSKLLQPGAENDSPRSLFYVDTPIPVECKTADNLQLVGSSIEDKIISPVDNAELQTNANQMASQEEIDSVINFLAGPRKHLPKMQTIPEMPLPGSPPKNVVAVATKVQGQHVGQGQLVSQGQPYFSVNSGAIPSRGPPPGGSAMPPVNICIQAPTPPANTGSYEMRFPNQVRAGLAHHYSDGMITSVIDRPSSNTWPNQSKGWDNSVNPLTQGFGPPMNAQSEAEFAQYLASVGVLVVPGANQMMDMSTVGEGHLNKSWPRQKKDGHTSWLPLNPDGVESSSESDSDGEQLLSLGLGPDFVNAMNDTRRHSCDEGGSGLGLEVSNEYPLKDLAEIKAGSRSAEDLSRGYNSTKTWPPKQLWNRPSSSEEHMASLASHNLFSHLPARPQAPQMPQPHLQGQPGIRWVPNTQQVPLVNLQHQHQPWMPPRQSYSMLANEMKGIMGYSARLPNGANT